MLTRSSCNTVGTALLLGLGVASLLGCRGQGGFDVALEPEDGAATSPPAHTQSPLDDIARSELTAAFRRAMLELPLQHREIIALCDLEELPYATVANILHCPVGTVRSRLHRARALLTIRLASLELVDLHAELPIPQRGLS